MGPEKAFGILSAIAEINGDEDLLIFNPTGDAFFEKKEEIFVPEVKGEKGHKKPRLTFEMLNIPIGSELVYKDDPTITVKVMDSKSSVEYQGNIYKISRLITLLKNGGQWQGGEYLLYRGKKLTDIRKEIEENSED